MSKMRNVKLACNYDEFDISSYRGISVTSTKGRVTFYSEKKGFVADLLQAYVWIHKNISTPHFFQSSTVDHYFDDLFVYIEEKASDEEIVFWKQQLEWFDQKRRQQLEAFNE